MTKAGLIESPKRGVFVATDAGTRQQAPSQIRGSHFYRRSSRSFKSPRVRSGDASLAAFAASFAAAFDRSFAFRTLIFPSESALVQ